MDLTRRKLLALSSVPLIAASWPDTLHARRGRGRGHDDDHGDEDYEQAREAVGSGEALPLSEIVAEVKKVIEGDVLDVELMKRETGITYQILLLSRSGTYHKVVVDAKTKVILKIEKQ